jgi:tRNA(Ile)-lysidine synthase
MNLQSELLKYNKRKSLFSANDKILLAVSGGVDSMVMLALFLLVGKKYNLKIFIAHFNHQLRGKDSDADQIFVKESAAKFSIPFFTKSIDVLEYSKSNKISIEMAARECRFQFLNDVRLKLGAASVSLAHNANDQAETIVQHFMRGSGVKGLAGIQPKSKHIIRPLLFASRNVIEKYAQDNTVVFRDDVSNFQPIYQRNKIRLEFIPHLEKEYNPSIIRTINHLGENFAELDAYLEKEAEKAFQHCLKQKDRTKIILDISKFFMYFSPLKKYILRIALEQLNIDPSLLNFELYQQIEALVSNRKGETTLPLTNDTLFSVSVNDIYIGPQFSKLTPLLIDKVPGQYELSSGWIFEINRTPKPLEQVFKSASVNEEWIDEESIQGPIRIRPIEKGDFFKPVNSTGTKSVSDYIIDHKISNYERQIIPILECSSGIIWIAGLRLDDRFKITRNTKSVLHVTMRNQIESEFRV